MAYIIKDNPRTLNPVDYLRAKDPFKIQELQNQFTQHYGHTPNLYDKLFINFVFNYLVNVEKDPNVLKMVGTAMGLGAIAYLGYKLGKSFFTNNINDEMKKSIEKKETEGVQPKEDISEFNDKLTPNVSINYKHRKKYLSSLFIKNIGGIYDFIFTYNHKSPLQSFVKKVVEKYNLGFMYPNSKNISFNSDRSLTEEQEIGISLLLLSSKYFRDYDIHYKDLNAFIFTPENRNENFRKFKDCFYEKVIANNGKQIYCINSYRTYDGIFLDIESLKAPSNDTQYKEEVANILLDDMVKRLRYRMIVLHYTESRNIASDIDTYLSNCACISYEIDLDGNIYCLWGEMPTNAEGFATTFTKCLLPAISKGLVDKNKFIDDVSKVMAYTQKPIHLTRDLMMDYTHRLNTIQIEIMNLGCRKQDTLKQYGSKKQDLKDYGNNQNIDIESLIKKSSVGKGNIKIASLFADWRGKTYFHIPNDQQLKNVVNLIVDICNRHKIPKNILDRNLFFKEDVNLAYYSDIVQENNKFVLKKDTGDNQILHKYYTPLFMGICNHYTFYDQNKYDLDVGFYPLYKELLNSGFREVQLNMQSNSGKDFFYNKNIALALNKIVSS